MKNELKRHREYSLEEVSEAVARYRASGLGLARFAREQGIPHGRLHYWIYDKTVKRSPKSSERAGLRPAFQEVKVGALLAREPGWAAEVSLPQGVAVRFSGAAAPGWIGCVVQALQRPC